MTGLRTPLFAFALLIAAAPAARAESAEPATGFLLQGQLQANLSVIPAISAYTSLSVMPQLRIGAQLHSTNITLEINYQSFTLADTSGSSTHSDGLHVLALGPNVQPILWRSRDGAARLAASVGCHLGGVIGTSSAPMNNNSPSDTILIGGFSAGLAGQYFPHRNFGVGIETGVRAEFISDLGHNSNSSLVSIATIYAALSIMFVAGG